MRALGGRPILMERYPEGAGGPSFFQKRVPKNAPDWLETTTVQTPNGTPSQALVAADVAHIVWAVNLGCLGLHVWPYLAADPEHSDELRIDVDPSPGVTFDMVREAADEVRGLLTELGLSGAPKTTGRNGIHIYVRLLPEQDSFAVRAAAVALARELERRRPDLITAAWWKEERGTRVFIDFNQNAPHKTVLGAWSVRPRVGGQVSTPFAWDELDTDRARRAHARDRPGSGRRGRGSVGGDDRLATVARAAARAPPARHGRRDDGRAVAAGLPEDAERAGPGRAEQGAQDRGLIHPSRVRTYVRASRGDDPARRPRRVLRVGRAARRPAPARAAGDRRRRASCSRRATRRRRTASAPRWAGGRRGGCARDAIVVPPRMSAYSEAEQGRVRGVRGHDAARRGALDRRGVPRRPRPRAARRHAASRSPRGCGATCASGSACRSPSASRGRSSSPRSRAASPSPTGCCVVPPDRELRVPPPAAGRAALGRRPGDRRASSTTAGSRPSARSPRSARARSSRCSAGRRAGTCTRSPHNRDPRRVRTAAGAALDRRRSARSAARAADAGRDRRQPRRRSSTG